MKPSLATTGFAVFLLSSGTARPISAADINLTPPGPQVVAQSDYDYQNGNTGGVTVGYPYTQTFTATSGGTLFSIGAGFFAPQTGLPSFYTFQFRNTTPAGLPAAQVIASVNVPTTILTIPPPLPGNYGWIDLTADFSSFGIQLEASQKYAFSVDVPGTFGTTTHNNFFWGFTMGGYAGGEPYNMTPSGPYLLQFPYEEDFLFTVTAVPEPSVLPLVFWLCAWAARRSDRL
ncbi:MAG: hypothetical protein HOP33_22680 [Verrucomicrobia bacterium]|nr:hypothetical protein [Verrucomicrobiota bacterium]